MKKKLWLSYVLLAVVFGILVAVLWCGFENFLDADMSSELILAKILSKQNAILTSDWYYSTELRVLNTQLIYAIFFKVFHDWTVIRTASVIVMYLLLLLGIWYFVQQYHCRECFGVVGALFLLPFSQTYFNIVLSGAYYIPHILISIFSLALIEHYFNKRWKWLIGVNCGLAFVAGLGG